MELAHDAPAVAETPVRALRQLLGISQEDFSKRSGLPRYELSRIETGRNAARSHRVREALSKGFGLDLDEVGKLLDGTLAVVDAASKALAKVRPTEFPIGTPEADDRAIGAFVDLVREAAHGGGPAAEGQPDYFTAFARVAGYRDDDFERALKDAEKFLAAVRTRGAISPEMVDQLARSAIAASKVSLIAHYLLTHPDADEKERLRAAFGLASEVLQAGIVRTHAALGHLAERGMAVMASVDRTPPRAPARGEHDAPTERAQHDTSAGAPDAAPGDKRT